MSNLRKTVFAKTAALALLGSLSVSPLALAGEMQKNGERSVYESSVNLKAFSQVDKDTSGQVEFSELKSAYQQDLKQRDWSEDKVMDRFDDNADDALNSEEYAVFARELLRSDRLSQSELESQAQTSGQARSLASHPEGSGMTAEMDGEAQGVAQYSTRETADPAESDGPSLASAPATQAKNLEGRDVVNREGETLGEVEKVIVKDNRVTDLVISVGGFIGIGDKEVLVDARQFKAEGNQIVWNTPMSEDQLDNMPEYREEQYSLGH
ncbi:PRC-barrel domain-containing protein [Gilvimarinus sp. DA14]|uniref:PRC-barrel domain-containing protein n=1 Tax=Gilvimarinus sp. DA14 TaxID=2956798 RepID=UPI0020B6967F|nr:PRC-barrel domain-containing protein [Gilvimarinus sp. DA14]UTF61444.1 PRC-barrel domain-containing protein [Gilvimarinus sp. DA14]